MDDKRYCQAIKRDGTPCTAWADRSTGLCSLHGERAKEIQAKGGRSKRLDHQLERRLPTSLKPVLALLAQALEETHGGKLAPSQAQAIASLSSAMVRCMEMGVLQERIEALEEKVEHERFTV